MVLPLLGKYGTPQAKLFGSYARKTADAESDIDLLLFADNNFKPPRYLGVAEDLHRASDKHVDAYGMPELDEGSFRENALKEAVAL